MKQADIILSHAYIVTMDDKYRILQDGAIAIAGDEIVAIADSNVILAGYEAEEMVDCGGTTIIPGLINAHTHVPMSLLRGLNDDQRLDVWLMGYVMPVEREFVSPGFVRLGTLLSCAELIRSGVTCFADMYYFEETVAQATSEVGLRAICGQSVLKFPSPDAESYEVALSSARQFIERWKDHPLIIPAIAPHAAYSTTDDILRECSKIAREHNVPLHTHIAETKHEVDDWREQHDMPVVPWVKKLDLLEANVIAAHCVHVDEGEIRTLEHYGTGIAHNPSSNLKLASGFAPVVDMLDAGLNVGIGTDGPASNNDLDMFEEVRLASFIAKATTGDPTALPAKQAFSLATSMGAKALHIDHLVGSLEVGKRADIVLLDLNKIHNLPRFDREPDAIYSRLIYSAKSTDVRDVMVNGRWLMREKQLLTINVPPLLEAAADYAKRIDAFLAEREGSVLSKLIAIGGAEQEESYEVQMKVQVHDPSPVLEKLDSGDLEIIRTAHYVEYDTYFQFDETEPGRLRYREDEFIDKEGNVFRVRYRLTLTGPAAEASYPNSVLLSRSRFIAPAIHSLRFYREYFQPQSEIAISKDRLRWLVRFKGESFFVNLDKILQPDVEDHFLEIKSRTWSRRDAENKAGLISELLEMLGAKDAQPTEMEYPDLMATL